MRPESPHTTPSPTVPNLEAFLSSFKIAASPDSPPSRPGSALSGGSSFINDTDDEETKSDEDSFTQHPFTPIRPRAKANALRRDHNKCILCGTSSDEVIRLTGIEDDGDREVYYSAFGSVTPSFLLNKYCADTMAYEGSFTIS
jgi:hypothetical protein